MNTFSAEYERFLSDFGKGRTMVLSTAEGNVISSRMMSVVLIEGRFYFQTDCTFRKYRQLSRNPNAALCIDNIQIEGICEEIGHPLDHAAFCERFAECFKGSFDAYTALQNERLFTLKPTRVERWIYREGVPYVEMFDVRREVHEIQKYSGVQQ